MAEMNSATQDFDLISDLRELNGRPKDTPFEILWCEIKSLLEAHARVDDIRHREIMLLMLKSCQVWAGKTCRAPASGRGDGPLWAATASTETTNPLDQHVVGRGLEGFFLAKVPETR